MVVTLLEQLQQEPRDFGSTNHSLWAPLNTLLVAAIPDYQHIKMVLIRGEVIVIGCVRSVAGSRHMYTVMHSERTARDPAGSKSFSHHELLGPRPSLDARPVAMGISRIRADAEANYYSYPWTAWVTPHPETLAAWIHYIATTTKMDTPYLESQRRY